MLGVGGNGEDLADCAPEQRLLLAMDEAGGRADGAVWRCRRGARHVREVIPSLERRLDPSLLDHIGDGWTAVGAYGHLNKPDVLIGREHYRRGAHAEVIPAGDKEQLEDPIIRRLDDRDVYAAGANTGRPLIDGEARALHGRIQGPRNQYARRPTGSRTRSGMPSGGTRGRVEQVPRRGSKNAQPR